jgi:O-antigen/teichoic acid export membrane protein
MLSEAVSVKKSFFWSGIEQLGPLVVNFTISVALARILGPAAYGLIGMLALFMGVAAVFADSGLSSALVQRKSLTVDDETSVFALNVAAGFLLASLLCLISPLVARFYHQPILMPLLCANTLSIIFSSFGIVQSALLSRNMQFKTTAMSTLISTFIAGGTGLVMAYSGCGVWSLVGSGVTGSLVKTALLWKMSSWRPRGKVRRQCIQAMWGYSSNILYCSLIGVTYQNMYTVIIGKVYSPISLGYYDQANKLRMLPVGIISRIVNRVAFPLFSRSHDDKPLMLKQLREIIRSTMFFSSCGMVLLAVIADPLIPLLLTEKWRPVVPLLRILCYAGVFYPVSSLYLMSLQAQGHSHLNSRLETIKMIIGIIAVALVYRYGVNALAWSVVVTTVNAYFLNAWYNVKLLGYHWRLQAFDILPIFFLCGIAGYSAWWLGTMSPWFPTVTLLVQTGSFLFLCYFGVYIFRNIFFSDIWKHLIWACGRVR